MQHQPLEVLRGTRRFASNEKDRKAFLSDVYSAMAATHHTVHKDGNKAEEGQRGLMALSCESRSRLLRVVPVVCPPTPSCRMHLAEGYSLSRMRKTSDNGREEQ